MNSGKNSFRPKWWELRYHADLYRGGPRRENAVAKRGWHGLSINDMSEYEWNKVCKHAHRIGRDRCYLGNRHLSEDRFRGPLHYQGWSAGIYFAHEHRRKEFVSRVIGKWPIRDIEVELERYPSDEALAVLKGLNHHVFDLYDHDTGKASWVLSTEYHPRVVEFRLMIAD